MINVHEIRETANDITDNRDVKLIVDENIPPGAAKFLRKMGLSCVHIQELGIKGMDDESIFKLAKSMNSAILTNNGKDFIVFVHRPNELQHPGFFWTTFGWTRVSNESYSTQLYNYFTKNNIYNHVVKVTKSFDYVTLIFTIEE